MSSDSRQTEDRRKLRDILWNALQRPAGPERSAYVAQACGADDELRRLVESLLEAYPTTSGDLLSRGLLGEGESLPVERPGTVIGRYKLLGLMGEGGFGTVYRAEQTEPVTRQVALKIVKLGMDTKEVIARFEAERQALAMLDHPNIAKVFDAGATDSGRPYFVMDLIEGEPITVYADQRNLPVAQRLDLFLQICRAVQHAHSRGIIHRDLKPSNVVVIEEDGKPLVKVIDFGIAKSMQGRLTDKTLFTRREVLLGTPVYMSPEQLNLDADTVDARSDVYSLGVLLYELVAGAPPYESDTLRQAAFSEVQRILREVEPPKPSTRLERLGSKTTEIAKSRSVEPVALQRLVEGDLDWVVMRALEKEPGRRYATAADLAQDLQRHLRHEPVSAGPPSIIYRSQKFARRHQGALAAAAAIVLVASVALLFSLSQAREARLATERARQAEERARADSGRTGHVPAVTGAQQLIHDVVSVEEGAQLSPDETMLAYVRWDGPDADIWVRDLQTGEERNLTQAEKHKPGVYEACLDLFVWSPDSKSLAYLWDDGTAMSLRLIAVNGSLPKVSFTGTNQTYSVQVDLSVSRPRVLFTETDSTWYLPEAWTHDGSHLLCRRKQPEGMELMDIETGTMRPLHIGHTLEHPRFSPDDRHLVFSRSNHIHVLEIETGRVTQLTTGESQNTSPIWVADGSTILFSSDRLGNWDLWGVRIGDGQLGPPAFPVRYGVGNHDKRLTQSGKLIVHRKLAPGEGYTIARVAPVEPLPPSDMPGTIYFAVDDQLHTMDPDGTNRKVLPTSVHGEPSWALHGGHRWFLDVREVPGKPYPSGEKRREVFAVRGDGEETLTVQLTDDPSREPLAPRWARDRETGVADGVISWQARLWDQATSQPATAIFAAKLSFDEAGNAAGLAETLRLSLVEVGGEHDWSPAGDRLVYEQQGRLFVLDLASGATTNLCAGQAPRWSPDGTRIAFCDPMRSIRTISMDGTDLKTIAEIPRYQEVHHSPPGMMSSPVWSPDSQDLLYAYRKPGSSTDDNLYRIPAEGGVAVNLTATIDKPDTWVAWRGGEP